SAGGQSAGSGKSGGAAHPGEGWSLHEFPPGLLDAASRLNDAVRQHPVAGRIVEAGVADRVVRASLGGLPSQARLDWFVPFQGLVRLEMVNDLDHFDWQAWRGELVHRLAFDRAVLAEIIGLNMPVQVVAVELRMPWRCGVWQLTERALRRAGRENDQAIQRLRKCLESDSWATGYEQPRVLDYSNS
ncbi:MAG TPA: PD-(D/E)XK nuclease-like domain-containing protein, partial [Pirellulaceae bacterium]|nr:PD-(D/E)XK nuclease-like domain-containing protein [Pirellulaceae bacterium]